uniref:Helitron helicase-like domain-containing protein n=1 Tax=Octopus bimaculoides TaxID=37653 RepID=A0A0L8HF79_OCTBM
MTFVRHYGRPDLFITFTCNPKWVEVTRELLPHQQYCHRHDLIARIFKKKLTRLIDFIKKGQVFGPVKCHMYTVEWQKRGLPQAHILVWLVTKIDPTLIDEIIKAEIPNPTVDRQMYDKVMAHMVHGPCGLGFQKLSSCHKDQVCTKRYPKSFVDETQTAGNGYPLYRRRRPENGGFTITLRGHQVDNRWVVPYCPLLMTIFNAHINMEFCHSVLMLTRVRTLPCSAFKRTIAWTRCRSTWQVDISAVGKLFGGYSGFRFTKGAPPSYNSRFIWKTASGLILLNRLLLNWRPIEKKQV